MEKKKQEDNMSDRNWSWWELVFGKVKWTKYGQLRESWEWQTKTYGNDLGKETGSFEWRSRIMKAVFYEE